jgi:hypothetical protein
MPFAALHTPVSLCTVPVLKALGICCHKVLFVLAPESPYVLCVLCACICREQQQQSKSKQGSPLSKWRKGSSTTGGTSSNGSKPTAACSGSSTAAVPAAAAGSGSAGDASSFSPMTSQLPARTTPGAAAGAGAGGAAAQQQWPEDDTYGQVSVESNAQLSSGCMPADELRGAWFA